MFKYQIDFEHFRVIQYSNEILTMIINPIDSLYFENGAAAVLPSLVDDSSTCFEALKNKIEV